jgi:hypothetical protein
MQRRNDDDIGPMIFDYGRPHPHPPTWFKVVVTLGLIAGAIGAVMALFNLAGCAEYQALQEANGSLYANIDSRWDAPPPVVAAPFPLTREQEEAVAYACERAVEFHTGLLPDLVAASAYEVTAETLDLGKGPRNLRVSARGGFSDSIGVRRFYVVWVGHGLDLNEVISQPPLDVVVIQ